MTFSFKKNIIVGVSISPEKGLEVAQVDFLSKTVLKYGCRSLTYDLNRKEVADLDIFKETLSDLLFELEIPKGSEIVLNFPTINFKITDYPASLNEEQVQSAIEEDLYEHPLFKDVESCISAIRLPNSTMQFHKVAYTILQKTMLIEIAMQIKELGYKLHAIDTSVGSTFNALLYNQQIETMPNMPWLLLIVESNMCHILSMMGNCYIDAFEENISIGEVLGDAENYATVTDAVNSLLKNLPSQRLFVISKTDVISAEILAEKLDYSGQIIHQDANCFATELFLNVSDNIEPAQAKNMSLDVIGAAIYREMANQVAVKFNLYNSSLGDVYLLEQPFVLNLSSFSIVMSIENMIIASIIFAIPIIILMVVAINFINARIETQNQKVTMLKNDIAKIDKYLKDNKDVSSDIFNVSDEIQLGVTRNKNVYTYYSIVGTEIPKKLWLTALELGKHTTIEGQADNLESVYSFFRNIKDYNPESGIKLQKLDLAAKSKVSTLTAEDGFDTESIMSSMDADYYSFRMSDGPEPVKKVSKKKNNNTGIPDLEPLE